VGGKPVYVNTMLLLLHIAAFAIVAILTSMNPMVLSLLGIGTGEVIHHGQIWRLVSYIIFPPQTAISFIFAMGFLFYFGRQVEQFVGRRTYITFYAALVLIPAFIACLLALFGVYLEDDRMAGYGTIFGVFVAFATLYPRVEICIWFVCMEAAHWCYALLGALSLCFIAFHQWVDFSSLWFDAVVGYFAMRLIGGGYGFSWLMDWLDERRTRRLAAKHQIKVMKDAQASESLDQILEKISKHGVGSLTSKERAALERARSNLLKRDQH
jgi:membrane associated rhomboid family serine protease